MIPIVKLKNLQSHTETDLDFVDGINVITGPSDVGKSAIIRGLKWWATNKPAGTHLRRHGTKETSVTSKGVTKLRTSSTHRYEVGDTKYKAIRTEVPPEVRQKIDLTEVNFQEQHAQYFLIADSSGDVAKELNKVADLQIIDLSRQQIRQQLKTAKTRKVDCEAELKETREKITDLDWILEADAAYRKIEELESLIESIDPTGVEAAIEDAKEKRLKFLDIPIVSGDLRIIPGLVGKLDYDESLERALQKARENEALPPNPGEDLITLSTSLLNLGDQEIKDLEAQLNTVNLEKKSLDRFPDVEEVPEELILRLTSYQGVVKSTEDAITDVDVTSLYLHSATRKYEEAVQEYNRKLKGAGACPLCGGTL